MEPFGHIAAQDDLSTSNHSPSLLQRAAATFSLPERTMPSLFRSREGEANGCTRERGIGGLEFYFGCVLLQH